jgi:catechol 2,3-dioxygenase-like lactoylglutathione lyase family enzyme
MSVRNLQHIALAVPDPAVGRKFYTDFGMEGKDQGKRIVMRCHGRDQDQVVLVEGKRRHMHHVGFGARADDGLLVNVRVADPAKWRTAPEWKINSPGNLNRAGIPGHPKRDIDVRPTRLGHTLRFTPQMDKMVDFYTRVVGLQLSDRAQDIVAFMRGQGGSDHHIFGFIKSERTGFHHASFEVCNVDEIGIGACRLLDKGYKDGWGFGRHVIGSNFFHYIRDPWESMAEYFCDIDYIPGDATWTPTNYSAEDSLYVWGPKPPEAFGMNFE